MLKIKASLLVCALALALVLGTHFWLWYMMASGCPSGAVCGPNRPTAA
jgi:hypothetical protein